MQLNKDYWENRYNQNDFPWDAGSITTPLKEYFDQIKDKNIRILIPGCGNGYEYEYLINNGFKNVFVLDYAPTPVQNLKKRLPESLHNTIIQQDFFEHDNTYDLIIEQTFFCALSPELRSKYVHKMHSLLTEKGKLAGLLFQFPLSEKGPPYGGSKAEYQNLFAAQFYLNILETAHNSIKPRQGNELFFIFTKKNNTMSHNTILNHQEIDYKIKRIAYQIYETFIDEKEIVIAGIHGNGLTFAQKLSNELQSISPIKVILCEVNIDKKNPNNSITTSIDKNQYTEKGLVLVDDVLNSGTTLIYGVRHFLDVPLKKFKTAVLVDRNHKKYPIKADFKGISLSTSLLEHVQVVFEDNNNYAYLE